MRTLACLSIVLLMTGCLQNKPIDARNYPHLLYVSDFPAEWKMSATTAEHGWGAGLKQAYSTGFFTGLPEVLGARIYYIEYENAAYAEAAFQQFHDAIFFTESNAPGWFEPPGKNEIQLSASESELACTMFDLKPPRRNCSFWARYNNCNVSFDAHIYAPLLTEEHYYEIISKIDERMHNLAQCTGQPK